MVVQLNAGHVIGVVEFAVESAGDLVSVGNDDDSFCGIENEIFRVKNRIPILDRGNKHLS